MSLLGHWGHVMHIYFSKLTIIGSDNGLSPGWRQAIIWTNVGILFIRNLGTNFSEILIKIYSFSFKKMHLKMLSENWQLFHFGRQSALLLLSDNGNHNATPVYTYGRYFRYHAFRYRNFTELSSDIAKCYAKFQNVWANGTDVVD